MIHWLHQLVTGVGMLGDFGSGLVLLIGGARVARQVVRTRRSRPSTPPFDQ
jgi:hypothetical protein